MKFKNSKIQSQLFDVKTKPVLLAVAIYAVCILLASSKGHAGALDTLPPDINSAMIRTGNVEGIGDRYNGNGTLLTLGDYRSVVFNAENLSRMNERAQQLIQALDQFGTSNLGTNISYGVFKVETAPQVRFLAPVYARGITKNWTVGFAVPIVNYKNNISFSTQNSNLAYYREQLGGLSAELDSALNIDLGVETQNTLNDRGYKSLESRDETFVGDMQLASIYNFWGNSSMTAQYQVTLNLPTGPQYDSDDLAALNIFGRKAIENKVFLSKPWGSKTEFVPYASLLYNLRDTVTARVPKDENDTIPDQTTKESVDRQVGTTATLGGDVFYTLSDAFTINGGYSLSDKTRDQYSGGKGNRYDLLGQNTNSTYHRVNAGISYSTVKAYFRKASLMPAVVSLNLSDTVLGRNVERRTMQELNFMMFF